MNEQASLFGDEAALSPFELPLIWPQAPVPPGGAMPPVASAAALFEKSDLISGLLVDVADGSMFWLRRMIKSGQKKLRLVVVVLPAGPTGEAHLGEALTLQKGAKGGPVDIEIRVLPVERWAANDAGLSTVPPTVIQGVETASGRTVWSIGSVGDCGCGPTVTGSVNFVFEPGEALRNSWREWFQGVWDAAAPLTPETAEIPEFRLPEGEPVSQQQWREYEESCGLRPPMTETGQPEYRKEDGPSGEERTPEEPWDGGLTALDDLAREMHGVYARGVLVTVAEGSRIRPLRIPVRTALLDQVSERVIGAVRQKQSFSLQILDEKVEKAIEKCRLVNDVVDLLSLPLSQGNRWMPNTARALLERELSARNKKGLETLKGALGGSIEKYVQEIADSVRQDLNAMYQSLVGGNRSVTEVKVKGVLEEVQTRLAAALKGPIAPKALYNAVSPPALGRLEPDENWSQPLSLLSRSAQLLRQALCDPFFARRVWGFSFDLDELLAACNPFGDDILRGRDGARAKRELARIDAILESDALARTKCEELMRVVRGA